MRIISYVVVILLINIPTDGLSNNLIQCNPQMKASWSYNRMENTSVSSETNEDLSGITLNFDFGFLKLTQVEGGRTRLFRQSVIEESIGDPLELEVRYESTFKPTIEQTSIVVFDPFCRRNNALSASIISTSGKSNIHTVYSCQCLSFIHHVDNFYRPIN